MSLTKEQALLEGIADDKQKIKLVIHLLKLYSTDLLVFSPDPSLSPSENSEIHQERLAIRQRLGAALLGANLL